MKRLDYISICRAILIVMVTIIHVQTQQSFALPRNWINVFVMPAFFLISGLLFDNEKWKKKTIREFVSRKFKTLIVPYIFFEFLSGTIKMIAYGTDRINLNGIIYNTITMNCNAGADWFLPTLFVSELMFFLLTKYLNKYIKLAVALLGVFFLFFLPSSHYLLVLVRMYIAYIFIYVGNISKKVFTAERGLAQDITLIVITFLITVAATATNGLISIWSLKLGNPIIFLIAGIAGSYMIVRVSRIIHSSKLSYIGDHSLSIMGTHQIISDILFPFFGIELVSPFPSLRAFIAIILFELPLVPLMDKYVPFLIGKTKPNR